MKSHSAIALTTFAALALALSPAASAVELVTNGGFETGTGADADGWDELPGPNTTVTRDATSPNAGSSALLIAYDNLANPPAGANSFAQQVSAANSLDPAKNINITVFAKSDGLGIGGVSEIEVQFLDQDGSHTSGFQGGQTFGLTGGLTASYQQFAFLDIDVPDTADSYLLRLRLVSGAVADQVGNVYFDDVSLTEVPEPGSLALMGLGGLAMIARRRNKA